MVREKLEEMKQVLKTAQKRDSLSKPLNAQKDIEKILEKLHLSVYTFRKEFYGILSRVLGDRLENSLGEEIKPYDQKGIRNAFTFDFLINRDQRYSCLLIQFVVSAKGKIMLSFYEDTGSTQLNKRWKMLYDTILVNKDLNKLAEIDRLWITPGQLMKCVPSIVRLAEQY